MRFLFLLLFSMYSFFSSAQIDPVKWESKLVKLDQTTYELQLTAITEDKWIVYSQFLDDGGPIPTEFTVVLSDGMTLDGVFVEPDNPIKKMDKLFDMVLVKYAGPATFRQRIKSDQEITLVTGTIDFMTCDDARCLPPKIVDFSAALSE